MTRSLPTLAAAVVALGLPMLAGTAIADDQRGFQAGDMMIRLRGLAILPEDNDSSVSTIGGKVNATNSGVPEVDFTYYITSHFSAEVIAATTLHSISASGTALGHVDVGNVWLLPPTLTAQYHPWPDAQLSPYIGAGVNYTLFYGSNAAGGAVTKAAYESNWGAAFQVGVDYHIKDNWYANLDVKQLVLRTKAKLDGGALTAKVGLDPLLLGVGIGYRF